MILVSDMSVALEFYEGGLGLSGEPIPGGYRLRCGAGTEILLVAGAGHASQAGWPVARFATDDLEQTLDRLRPRGVSEDTDVGSPVVTDEHGIAHVGRRSIASVRDPDDQIILLVQSN